MLEIYLPPHTLERRIEPFGVEWLEQVVERAHLECFDGVLVVRGDKDDFGRRRAMRAKHLDGADLVHALDLAGLCCSTGSACTTGSTEPSHVLTAMGYPDDEARGSLRISLGRSTTEAEIDAAIEIIPRVLADARAAAAVLAVDPLGQAVAS